MNRDQQRELKALLESDCPLVVLADRLLDWQDSSAIAEALRVMAGQGSSKGQVVTWPCGGSVSEAYYSPQRKRWLLIPPWGHPPVMAQSWLSLEGPTKLGVGARNEELDRIACAAMLRRALLRIDGECCAVLDWQGYQALRAADRHRLIAHEGGTKDGRVLEGEALERALEKYTTRYGPPLRRC